jgi:citrate lyase subunit beta/citryl-CoA lyase
VTWSPGPAWLFCPADRPDRYAKALAVADVVVLDLEDAVAPDRKAEARESVVRLFADGGYDADRTLLRVNAVGSPEHDADAELLSRVLVQRVMLAKAETAAQVHAFAGRDVVALVETPRGVENAGVLATEPTVVGLMWGADDLVAGLGGTSSRHDDGSYRDVARFARSRVLVAAKAHGRLAVDSVFMDIPDLDGLRAEAEDAVAVGFDAKVAIHPSQVEVLRAAYRPSPERVDWARRLLDHVGDDRGVTTFEGRMVDGPVYAQAERILELEQRTAR